MSLDHNSADILQLGRLRALWLHLSSKLERFETLPTGTKLGIVVAGYVLAVLIALGVVALNVLRTSGPDREQYAAMYDFGDLLLFLMAFGGVSLVPTVIALSLMRRSKVFWAMCSGAACAIAGFCVISEAVWYCHWLLRPTNMMISWWEIFTVPIFFGSPFLFVTFGLSALAAPKPFKWPLVLAALLAGACTLGAAAWFLRAFLRH